MGWFEKLSEYFPIEEMKLKEHIEILLNEKADVYFKDEGPEHVLIYAEFEQFIFIDYVYVSRRSRGKGLGRKLINKLKEKNKVILLEVEPVDEENEDTLKRLNFYHRHNFKHATTIDYNRKSLATGEDNRLEIIYWAKEAVFEQMIYQYMCQIYEEIHTYKDDEIYGHPYQQVGEVLKMNEDRAVKDLFDRFK